MQLSRSIYKTHIALRIFILREEESDTGCQDRNTQAWWSIWFHEVPILNSEVPEKDLTVLGHRSYPIAGLLWTKVGALGASSLNGCITWRCSLLAFPVGSKHLLYSLAQAVPLSFLACILYRRRASFGSKRITCMQHNALCMGSARLAIKYKRMLASETLWATYVKEDTSSKD